MPDAVPDYGQFPIHLTAKTTVLPGSDAGVNALALKNPSSGPMELLKVKWSIESPVAGDDDYNSANGGSISCNLALGDLVLTNGFVPIWNFGVARNLQQELVPAYPIYTWQLDHPLYIPAGALVLPSFRHTGQIQESIPIRVSYECRALPRGYVPPAKIKVPYIASWTSPALNGGEAQPDPITSSETDLINKFGEPLHIKRFVGRCNTYIANEDVGVVANIGTDTRIPDTLIDVRMVDSLGEPIVPNRTRFHQVFSAVNRAWDVDFKLPPRAYYIVSLDLDNIESGLGVVDNVYVYQVMVSMIGTREVERGAL